ncbi:MAG TPA: hypothetical protein VJ809_02180 [Pirellulales bacterium]|jgi:hypothetical protein|nr:hypothetical protein [Pirellulales bacterium]
MHSAVIDAKRDRTFWRGMYLIAFVIGVVVPIAGIVAASGATAETGWRSANILVPTDEAKTRGDVIWRNEYIAGDFQHRAYEYRTVEGPMLLLGLAWSGATLIGIAGLAAGAWIVIATGEKLGIEQGQGYLRGMFLMAFAAGAVVPIAAIIAAGVVTAEAPGDLQESGTALLIVMWCGMIAVCIAGLFGAAWMVHTAAMKLRPGTANARLLEQYNPRFTGEQAVS